MSAFISVQNASEICLLTDGAGYDKSGIVLTLGCKVTVGKVAKIAVTTRGNHGIGRAQAERLCAAADRLGVDEAVEIFAETLPQLASSPEHNGMDFMHWHICGWSELHGLSRYSAHNMPFAFSDGEAPLVLHKLAPAGGYYAANNASAQTLFECGVNAMAPGEALSPYMRRAGGNIMEAQRRTPSSPLPGETVQQYTIGGQCDLTIVTEAGVSIETLLTWPDRIGEPIKPWAGVNIARLPAGMSRQQRRAAEREARRRA